jgi:hypothetical protein
MTKEDIKNKVDKWLETHKRHSLEEAISWVAIVWFIPVKLIKEAVYGNENKHTS